MDRRHSDCDQGAVTTMTANAPEPDYSAQQGSGLKSQPSAVDADVAATARLLHRRHGWSWVAIIGFCAFILTYATCSNAASAGTPAPSWFVYLTIALGVLAVVGIVAAVADTVLLRRKAPAVRTQAARLAAHHPRRPHTRHYPPRHLVTWTLAWIGMLLILLVGVVSVSAPVDGVAYLAGAGNRVAFDPISYETSCNSYKGQYNCETSTEGILETGGAGTQADWPAVVPLGKPFQVREPVWGWGLGGALINNDRIAVVAIVVSLLIEACAAFVLVHMVLVVRNWRRHRRHRKAPVPVPVT
jgi:ABC-type glycerol-3-phosphate transport system permease component